MATQVCNTIASGNVQGWTWQGVTPTIGRNGPFRYQLQGPAQAQDITFTVEVFIHTDEQPVETATFVLPAGFSGVVFEAAPYANYSNIFPGNLTAEIVSASPNTPENMSLPMQAIIVAY